MDDVLEMQPDSEQVNDDTEPVAEEFSPSDLTEDQVKAGLANLSGGIATAQDVENAARAEEGLPPLESAGLLDFGPFNPDAALKAIFDKSVEVDLLRSSWQRKAEDAKDAKKEYEIGSSALLNLINTFKLRRQHALNPSQPYLKDVSGDAPAPSLSTSRCPWERDHPGQSCPICTAAQAKDLVPALESEVHPEHEGHAAVAESARVKNVLEPLAEKLRAVNVHATAPDLQPLSTDDLNALIAYADEPTPMPPQLIARCCRAAEPGTLLQVCQNCDRVLVEFVGEATAYPVDALVGFECGAYRPTEVAPASRIEEPPTQSTEPVRTIKPRGSKKTARKQPEQEHAKQVESGRKATTKKAAKRGKGRR